MIRSIYFVGALALTSALKDECPVDDGSKVLYFSVTRFAIFSATPRLDFQSILLFCLVHASRLIAVSWV